MDEAGIPGKVEELSAGPELFAAPDGQVNWIPGSRTLPEFLSAWCGEPVREPMPVPAFLTANGIVPPAETPDYKVLRNGYPAPGRVVSVYGVRSEGGILAFLHTCDCRPLNIVPEGEAATLLVAARDAEEELLAAALPADGSRLFTLDARGFGKSFPLTGDRDTDFFTPYGTEYFYDAAGVMLDSPLFSGRARDVLAALAVLRAAGYRSIPGDRARGVVAVHGVRLLRRPGTVGVDRARRGAGFNADTGPQGDLSGAAVLCAARHAAPFRPG